MTASRVRAASGSRGSPSAAPAGGSPATPWRASVSRVTSASRRPSSSRAASRRARASVAARGARVSKGSAAMRRRVSWPVTAGWRDSGRSPAVLQQAVHEVAQQGLGRGIDPQAVAAHVGVGPGEVAEVLLDAAGGVRLADLLGDRPARLLPARGDPRRLLATPERFGILALLAGEEVRSEEHTSELQSRQYLV